MKSNSVINSKQFLKLSINILLQFITFWTRKGSPQWTGTPVVLPDKTPVYFQGFSTNFNAIFKVPFQVFKASVLDKIDIEKK